MKGVLHMNPYMEKALNQANFGWTHKEGGPFGALILDKNGNIVSVANNQVLLKHDPTAHAEVQAIRQACEKLGTHDLSGYTLYTTCEPCPMCLSAIIWANIKKVYFGCTKKDAADIGFRDDMIYEYLKGNEKDVLELLPIDREDCIKSFNDFHNDKGQLY